MPTSTNAQPNILEMLLPFVFIFAIFYFLIIRPQGKKAKDHDRFIGELKRGDQVVTNSGILGRIEGLTEHIVSLEIANGIQVKVLKKQIAGSQAALLADSPKKA